MQFNWGYLITKNTLEKEHNANLKGEMAVVEVNQRQEETSQTNNDAKQKRKCLSRLFKSHNIKLQLLRVQQRARISTYHFCSLSSAPVKELGASDLALLAGLTRLGWLTKNLHAKGIRTTTIVRSMEGTYTHIPMHDIALAASHTSNNTTSLYKLQKTFKNNNYIKIF